MINSFQCIKNSGNVLSSIKIEDFLSYVKEGNESLPYILEARSKFPNDKSSYYIIKTTKIPCYTLNFTFNKKKSNETINSNTGFIYLDYDKSIEIDTSNQLIFATWLSLSGTGRGILVKVDSLTLENFKYTYQSISKELNIETDHQACKATQSNVLSYDPNIYINYDSRVWVANDTQINKKYQHSNIKIEKETICTVIGYTGTKVRYDNLNEITKNIDFNGEAIYCFEQKIQYAKCFLPIGKIKVTTRNKILSSYAYQLKALNPLIKEIDLWKIITYINNTRCEIQYPKNELDVIVKSIMSKGKIEPKLNATRRFFYNPDYDLSVKKRRQLSIKAINFEKTQNSIKRIEQIVNEWDFKKDGKITQKGIKAKGGGCLNTIKKYYHLFKKEINEFNKFEQLKLMD
ncbi:hypothetical protein EC396_13365 [Lutibacter sp. HS1-25]|uniref:BT4734/BF3469 family protein n=1 Tax=Lutibacter sp. HS1-25 TaxID=2485000 RepID=UPI0010132E34|nr:BT4734/BF3469 family protein [Lutibacter sp. HS1-25]RXP46864.1 hypothetical protein EC396_13365 [Lutibacter sp. HS1-25]